MIIITRQMLANQAAKAWHNQYYENRQWSNIAIEPGKIYNQLIALGNNPTPEQVNKTIGNESWTRLTCHECKNEVDLIIRLGEPPDWESNTAYICLDCLAKAVDMVTEYNVS